MIRGRQVRTVAAFEFLSTVKRKGYIIATFGGPLFLLLYAGLISTVGVLAARQEAEVRIYAVVDESGVLRLEGETTQPSMDLPDDVRAALRAAGASGRLGPIAWWENFVFRPFAGVQPALDALLDGEVKGVYVVTADYLASGKIESYSRDDLDFQGKESKSALRNLLLERLLDDRVSGEIAERVRRPIAETTAWTLTDDGEVEERQMGAVLTRLAIPFVFAILLFISLTMSAGYLLQGTATEKDNRVVEILLCSVKPDELLSGKLLGLGAAGLLQVVVWFGMVVFGGMVTVASLQVAGVEIPWLALALCLPFFAAGYLFLGSLMLGTGSLGNNLKESQQFSLVWSIPTVIPLVFLQILLSAPHGTLARVLSWIPFTSPVTVIFRTTLDAQGIAWWEIAGSFALLVGATRFALRFGARLFRVGLLLTGTRPKLREILRQARL